jgi:hypothetical protein
MTAWDTPPHLGEYARRLFSLRLALLGLLCCALVLSELRLDWAERLLGAYLVTTNPWRPESGLIWEVGRRARSAHQTLDRILSDRIAFQREAREANGFNDLAERLEPEQGVMLSAEHFRRLYLALPEEAAREMASPFRLLEIFGRHQCDRVYLKKTPDRDGLILYLLNRENRVLESLEISPRLLRLSLATEGSYRDQRLEQDPSFAGRIYPAERFFSILASLPDELRRAAVPYPNRLLEVQGTILRVGIGNEVADGVIRLGFEALEGERPRVVLMQGQEWAVWQLHQRLEAGLKPVAAGEGRS